MPTTTPAPLAAESVLSTFAQVDHDCPYADADLIARVINARAGDVQRAVEACEGKPVYGKLLAYQAALVERTNPAVLAERLRFEADCLTKRADDQRKEADSWRRHGASKAERAATCERLAIRYLSEAKRKLALARSLDETPEPPPAASVREAA